MRRYARESYSPSRYLLPLVGVVAGFLYWLETLAREACARSKADLSLAARAVRSARSCANAAFNIDISGAIVMIE